MSDLSALQRKIGNRQPATAPPPLTPERVWRRAVVHGLTRAIGLEVKVSGVACAQTLPDAVPERVSAGALAAFLDGPHGYGVVILSREIVAAMLEIQTLGRVQTRTLSDRAVTATDAAMVADPIDRVLAAQETLLDEAGAPEMAGGYRYAMRVETLREIPLSLEDAAHDVYTVTLEAGPGGPRTGTIDIVLPRWPAKVARPESGPDWGARMETRLMGAEVLLRAELARMSLSVSDLQALAPGDTLRVGRHAMGSVRMVAAGGHAVFAGQLGQSTGRKAVRIGQMPEKFTAATLPRARIAGPTDDS